MQRIEFRGVDDWNQMISIPVLEQEKPTVLRMWVAYDKGRRCSQYDYSEVKRGYYLYFSFEEPSPDYPARILNIYGNNCRVYLGEVERRSRGWHKDFADLAGKIVLTVINDIFPELKLEWDKISSCYWNGKGSGVGMFCDCYKVLLPKVEWLKALA